jgi:hypothetical protein
MADSIDTLAQLLRRVKGIMELDSELYDSQQLTLTDDEVLIAALESYQDRRHFYKIYRQAQAQLTQALYQELDRQTRTAALDGKKDAADIIDKDVAI